MGKLDLSKVKAVKAKIEEQENRAGYITPSSIKSTLDFRIAPPVAELDGMFCLAVETAWINGKKFILPSTFGQHCPITEEIAKVKADKDDTLLAILNSKGSNGMANFQKKTEYWMPILVLTLEDEDQGLDGGFVIEDGEWKLAQFNKTIHDGIITEMTSRFAGSDPTDMVKGQCFLISKSGKKLTTKYKVSIDRDEYDMSEFENLYKKPLNVYELAQKEIKPEIEYQKAIQEFLYGDSDIEVEEEDTEEEAPKPVRRATKKADEPKKPVTRKRRNLLKDLEETEDDE